MLGGLAGTCYYAENWPVYCKASLFIARLYLHIILYRTSHVHSLQSIRAGSQGLSERPGAVTKLLQPVERVD